MNDDHSPSRRRFLTASGGLLLAAGAPMVARSQTPQDVTIALSSNSFSIVAVRIAERRRLFEKHGLNARIVVMDSANASFAALLSGSAQLASSGLIEALAALSRGQETIAVSNIYRGMSCVFVLAKSIADKSGVKPDAPVTERLKVLDGLSFAGPSPTSGFAQSAMLSTQSVGAKLKMSYMAQPAMAAALESGAVQAMAAGTPFWVPPVLRGVGVVWVKVSAGELPEQFVPTTSGTLLMTKAYARSNPDVMRKIQEVVKDVGAVVTSDKEGVLKDLAAIYPSLDSQTIALGFNNEWQNLTRSTVTEADVRHDIAIMKQTGQTFPGLDTLDPKSLVSL
jgi:ABC-type nitrate/sulfonate/bicarbonate transport system substrate-binding protein